MPLIMGGYHTLKYNRWISLDISTNTGFTIFAKNAAKDSNGYIIDSYGLINAKITDYKSDIKKYSDFPDIYPVNFLYTSMVLAKEIRTLIREEKIEYVVIEHTEKGKQRLSQRTLEWFHFAICNMLLEIEVPFKYLLVSDWRKEVSCYIKCWPEYIAYNKQIKTAKKTAVPTKKGRILARIDGRVVSKIDQKKLSIIIANQTYDLNISDDNIADAINIGTAAISLGLV